MDCYGSHHCHGPTILSIFGHNANVSKTSFNAFIVKVYQASKRLSAGQSHSCRKAESQYGKIFYVPQPLLTASKVTLGVPMIFNPIICKRKEAQPLAALDSKQKISLSLM
jgi:hypothetical protein